MGCRGGGLAGSSRGFLLNSGAAGGSRIYLNLFILHTSLITSSVLQTDTLYKLLLGTFLFITFRRHRTPGVGPRKVIAKPRRSIIKTIKQTFSKRTHFKPSKCSLICLDHHFFLPGLLSKSAYIKDS